MKSVTPPTAPDPDGTPAPVLGRRSILAAGGVVGLSALAGCGSGSPVAPPTGTTPPPTPTPTSTTSAAPTTTGIPWSRLAAAVTGVVALPGSRPYSTARLTENPRFDDARPLAVVSAVSAADVQAAVRFAREHDVPLAVRSGGHSYAGWSSGGTPRAMVIDLRGLHGIDVSGAQATLGSGISLAQAYAGMAAAGRAIPGGSCATVGLGGLALGGGVGVLTRAYGLTADSVRSVQLVNADGDLVRADATTESDLFWALRGGGGRLGVVTSFTMNTQPAPLVHTFYRRWAGASITQVLPAWQSWITTADRRAWATLKLLGGAKHASGPSLLLSGTWIGPAGTNPLPRLLAHCPPPVGSFDSTVSYGQAMATYAGCAGIPVSRCHTGPSGALEREPLAATSHVASRTLPAAGIATILDAVSATPSTLKEAGISIDSLGGATNDLPHDATAWPYRGALFTVQYTATVTQVARIQQAQAWARHLRGTLVPWWGQAAYVNYVDPTLPSSSFFGSHLERLRSIKQAVDPSAVFGPSW
ncbi:MAG: FAD-binding oxidoreductase [Marmoricola sp.]